MLVKGLHRVILGGEEVCLLACSQRLGELMTTQHMISIHGIEGVHSRVTMQVGAESVRGFSEFAVPFRKDEVGAHAGPH